MTGTAHSQVIELFTLAIADGFVSPEELALIHEKGRGLGLTDAEVDEVIRNPERVRFEAPDSLVAAITRLYDLACVLVTDGRIDSREVDVMRSFAQRFGIKSDLIENVVSALVEEVGAGTSREQLITLLASEVQA